MTQCEDQSVDTRLLGTQETVVSRRSALGASALAFLGLVSGSVAGQEEVDLETVRKSMEEAHQRMREDSARIVEAQLQRAQENMSPAMKGFFSQMRGAKTAAERDRIVQDWQLQQMLVRLRGELGVSEEEWSVIQPRVVAVHGLARPPGPHVRTEETPLGLVTQRVTELWELLGNKEAKPEEIKAKLIALRSAKEQVRQELVKAQKSLRQIMTLRQEAVLVLYGLLD